MKIVAQRNISQTNILVRVSVQLLVSDACQSASSSWVILSTSSACTSSPPIFCSRSTRSANMSTQDSVTGRVTVENVNESDSSLNFPEEPETYLYWGCKRDRLLLVLRIINTKILISKWQPEKKHLNFKCIALY